MEDRSKLRCNFSTSSGSVIDSLEMLLHDLYQEVPTQRTACIKNGFYHWMVPKIALYTHRWLIASTELAAYAKNSLKMNQKWTFNFWMIFIIISLWKFFCYHCVQRNKHGLSLIYTHTEQKWWTKSIQRGSNTETEFYIEATFDYR